MLVLHLFFIECIYYILFIHLLMDSLDVSTSWLLWIDLLGILKYEYLNTYFQFFWGCVYMCVSVCVVMVLLGHMVCVKVFEKLSSCIVPEPIYLPYQKCTRVWVFPHICQHLLFNFFFFLDGGCLSKSFAIF